MDVPSPQPSPAGNNLPSPNVRSSNTLSSQVTSVLSTSFSDADFGQALALFDQQNLSNDGKTRRNIKLSLQKDVMDYNGLIVDRFGCVAEQLNRVNTILKGLNTDFEEMRSRVERAQEGTSAALHEATSMLRNQETLLVKQRVLSLFKDRFILTEDEEVALTSTAEPVDGRFFATLSKAKRIAKDCELLLGLEKQTFGLDLMEQTTKNLNLGFQKLYKWIQREFKTLNLENPQMSSSIRQALRVLAERPSLFQKCLDFFSEARERILSEAFHLALTGAAASDMDEPSIKPIDLAAHDALRYVGDMLAWIHTAAVSEREALEVLFVAEGEELATGLKTGKDAEIWRLVADDDFGGDFDAIKALNELVDKDMFGTVRLLRQRVEQVIQTTEETILVYKLATLLNFYSITFDKLLGPSSNLRQCLQNLEDEALRQFRSLIKDSIASVHGHSQHVPADLAPPIFLQDALDQLRAILQTRDSSLSMNENGEMEFEGVMADAFEPFLSGCENLASSLTPLKASIFLMNCSLASEKCLSGFNFTKRHTEQLRLRIQVEATSIVQNQYQFFCQGSGLASLLISGDDGVATVRSDMDQNMLSRASQQLDEFLPAALMDALDRIKCIRDVELTRRITDEAAGLFFEDFKKLEEEIERRDLEADADKKGAWRAVFPRTSTDIRVLLS